MLFKVWAPNAKEVAVDFHGETRAMTANSSRWWNLNAPRAKHGTDYAFHINDGPSRPDPRSPWQPSGVDGPSRTVDHAEFSWTDGGWQAKPLSSALLYELHVGTFTPAGTFDAAIDKLSHLQDLGVSHIELMPIAEFRGNRGWGYDGVDLFAPHHAYGGPDGLKRFVDACHAHQLGVILDVVYNHLGPSGNYLSEFGPYFTERHQTPWGSAINFDGPDSDEVRRFFCDNALMWLRDYHMDGLRLDAIHAIVDTSAIPFLEQLATEVDELKAHLGRHLVLIAESDLNDPRVVRPWEIGGFGLDAQWSDDVHHAVHTVLTGEQEGYYADFGSLHDLAIAMRQPYVYANRHSQVRRRRHGRATVGLSGSRFVAYLQNHDQLGNRALGERMTQLTTIERAKIGAALVMISPFVPMWFQGEEWGASSPFLYFVDLEGEPELAQAVYQGRWKEFESFGWKKESIPDPGLEATYRRSQLNWSELSREPHADMLAWYRQLVRVRRAAAGFTDGRLDLVDALCDEDVGWLRVDRGPVSTLCNLSSRPCSLPLPPSRPRTLLLASAAAVEMTADQVILPPNSVAILGPPETESSLLR